MNSPDWAQMFFSKLQKLRETKVGEWVALCPGHDDHHPSLGISLVPHAQYGQRLLLCCCSPEDILKAIDLTWQDLVQRPPDGTSHRVKSSANRTSTTGVRNPESKQVAFYDYRDEQGGLLYQVIRNEPALKAKGKDGKFLKKDFTQHRPDGDGGWIYDLNGVRRVLYRLPETIAAVKAGKIVLVCEGEKDTDNVRQLGLTATTNPGGAGKVSAELLDPLRGAHIVISPHNDEAGRKHRDITGRNLQGLAARVQVLTLPGLADKGDVSDWIGNGGTAEELQHLIAEAPEWQDSEVAAPTQLRSRDRIQPPQYEATPTGLVWVRPTNLGPVRTILTNFTARILEQVIEDDGVETTLAWNMEGERVGRRREFSIPASAFPGMGWVTEQMGAAALVYPGTTVKDHARAAIQMLSNDPPERRVFTHTGWRQIDGRWAFLTGGAVLGIDRPDSITVRLSGSLCHYALPERPIGAAICEAVRSVVRLMDLAPEAITAPALGSVFRAVLGHADFSLAITGRSGAFKSELSALLM
jgi:hypothetical protein